MADIKATLEDKMQKTFDALLHQFSRLRTGRASASILDEIRINYYGAPTPIKTLCNINTPEPRLIVVHPYDKTTLTDIEKGIAAANLGVHPENDGNVIRLPFQPLTEEKRKEIVKSVRKLTEDAKVSARNLRRDANEQVKKQKKDALIAEDEETRLLKEIQDLTDKWVAKLDAAAANKEKEVMEV